MSQLVGCGKKPAESHFTSPSGDAVAGVCSVVPVDADVVEITSVVVGADVVVEPAWVVVC